MHNRSSQLWVLAVLLAISTPPTFARDDNEKETSDLWEQAKRVMNYRSPGSTPFQLVESLRIKTKKGIWAEGTYTLIWASPDHWKDELSLPDYHEIRAATQRSIWRTRSQPAWTAAASRARSIVDLAATPVAKPEQGVIRIYNSKMGEVMARCVFAVPFRGYEIEGCFDASHGYILTLDSKLFKDAGRTEWGDYLELTNHFVPRQRRESRNGDLVTEVVVREVSLLSSVDPALFASPAGAQEIPGCYDPMPPKPKEKPEPAYSREARMQKIQGRMSLDVQIDGRGLVESAFVVEPLEPTLDRAAIDKVKKHWRFEPATCSGVPVPAEFAVEFSFHLF